MTRSIFAGVGVALLLVSVARCETKPGAATSDKPVISVVLSPINNLYSDLKMVFDLANDPKGYTTLKDAIDVFLDGVETNKTSGVRIFTNAEGLRPVISLPVASEDDFKKFRLNLWDLDVKTAEPPEKQLLPQVPQKIRRDLPKLKLAKNERLIFGLYDGYMRYESGQLHLAEALADVRIPKGGVSPDLLQGMDLAIHIDGESQTPADRVQAFAKAKKEILGALEKGEQEHEADFELRKTLTEHQVAEIERFFSESSKIQIGFITAADKKHVRGQLELVPVKGTSLEQSIHQIVDAPDDFAGVGKADCALAGSINFPLDALRQEALKSISTKARVRLKDKIDADESLSADQKATDKDLVDLVFDVVDDFAGMGVYNGFLRVWSNGDSTLTTVGATRVLKGGKFVDLLKKFATREGQNSVQLNVDSVGGIDIHKLTVADVQKDYPELFAKDGTMYVGTAETAVWYALGEKSLERLKHAIEESQAAGAKPGPMVDLHAKLLPLVEVWDKIRSRQLATQKAKPAEKTKAGDKEDRAARAKGVLAELQPRKIALEAFPGGNDTVSMSLERKADAVTGAMQFDEGILRFVGKALSKFVKDNLGDD
ncbi:MAG: hypothetical protein ACT4QC_05300 [Planctomycetaceae bacterium]